MVFFGVPKLVHKDPNPLGPLGADTLGFSKDMESPGRTLLLGQEKSARQTGFPFRNMQRPRSRHILQVSLDPLHLEQWASQFIQFQHFDLSVPAEGWRRRSKPSRILSDDQRRSATISVDVSDLRPQQMSCDRNALNALGEKSRSVFRCDDQRNFRKQTFRELELILHMGIWFSHVFT